MIVDITFMVKSYTFMVYLHENGYNVVQFYKYKILKSTVIYFTANVHVY